MEPGHVRDYTPKAGTTCCEGTALESATKYQDSVYFTKAGGSALYVNLYSRSTLKWAEKGVTVTQRTRFPFEGGSTITIKGNATFDLRLRVPSWATAGFQVTVNDKKVRQVAVPGTYLTISRRWRTGDEVRILMPFSLRVEQAPDKADLQSLFYGPINLVARDPRKTLLPFSLYRNAALSGDLLRSLKPVPGKPMHYTLAGVEFAPFFEGTEDPTHVYFQRSEPAVVFGNCDSGVANPAKSDGTTLLDEIWAAAPFKDKGALTRHVRTTVDALGRRGPAHGGERQEGDRHGEVGPVRQVSGDRWRDGRTVPPPVSHGRAQAEPLSVNATGFPFRAPRLPVNPKVTDAPGAMLPFQAALRTVTAAPVWVYEPLQS